MVIASFPVEHHIQKYMVRRYGNAHIVNTYSLIGQLVGRALTEKMVRPSNPTPYEYRYSLLVPPSYFKKKKHSLTLWQQQFLSKCCAMLFNEAMCEYVDLKCWEGGKAEPSIKAFMDRYAINEDDIKQESLYRSYMRHCERKIKADMPPEKKKRTRAKRNPE